jgi:tetratricopeptide (TPR) repeat protein
MKRQPVLVIAVLLVAALATLGSCIRRGEDGPSETPDPKREAETLYSEGRYAEARPLLEQLVEAGAATGPLLYRLAYCQRAAGDEAASAETQRRALDSLEREVTTAENTEVPFYLVNTYQNLGQDADARRVAAEATARVERDEFPRPDSGNGMFQLGKLYADQGLEQQATEWYAKAVDALTEGGRAGGTYVRRASRYVAERAFRQREFATAQQYYSSLIDAGEGTAADLDRLAVCSARVGMYEEAAQAWQQAELANPVDPNRPRYGSRLATMAAKLEVVPERAPQGKAWTELTKEELESLLKEQSEQVKATLSEVQQAGEIDKETRQQYRAQLNEIRAVFVPAALEYVLRGHSIRQTSFFGGYAPLILNRKAWRLRKPETATKEAE